MSVPGDLGAIPTRADVRDKIVALIGSDQSREEIANWAALWVRQEDPQIEDACVWEALKRLTGADLRSSRTAYLHSDADFVAWLKDLGDS